MKLAGKVALITGGNSGLGRSTAILFGKEGAKVAIVARNAQTGNEVVDIIKKNGGEAIFIQADVAKAADCQNAVETTIKTWGKIDVLFNNAGVELVKCLHETTEEEWDMVMNTNLKSIFFTCKYTIPYMLANGGGSIINTGSQLSLVAAPNFAAYTASKGAILNLGRAMALDYAKKNIRVNTFCPGAFATPLLLRQFEEKSGPQGSLEQLAALHPMGRIGNPDEAAPAVLFLACQEDSSFVTGSALVVDGGYTAW